MNGDDLPSAPGEVYTSLFGDTVILLVTIAAESQICNFFFCISDVLSQVKYTHSIFQNMIERHKGLKRFQLFLDRSLFLFMYFCFVVFVYNVIVDVLGRVESLAFE